MPNQQIAFSFNGLAVAVIDHNGEGWFTANDIGTALEYSDPRDKINQIFERNREELENYSVTLKLTATDGKQYNTRVYNEEGTMIICFFSKQPKAATFRKWAVGVLKNYRHHGDFSFLVKPITEPIAVEDFEWRYQVITSALKNLKKAQITISITGEEWLAGKEK